MAMQYVYRWSHMGDGLQVQRKSLSSLLIGRCLIMLTMSFFLPDPVSNKLDNEFFLFI